MIWLAGSSPTCSSNLEISEGSLVSMAGQAGSWTGSLINLLKYGKLRPTIYGK